MFKCPECGYTAEEDGDCPKCKVQMEPVEYDDFYDPGDEK